MKTSSDTVAANNLIAHYYDPTVNHDKVYIACIRKNKDGEWEAVGKWGRRGGRLNEQIKSTHADPTSAREVAGKLFRAKVAKGYVGIFSGSYNGPVTVESVKRYLEDDTWIEKEKPAAKKKKQKPVEEFVVRCDDNTGMKDKFDQGETYIAKTSSEEDMVEVLDAMGKWQTCRESRFERVEE